MNIVQLQDQLKNFSQEQLVKEMQMPSGNAPPYLVLSEIMRRKQMETAAAGQQAPQESVAEEAIAAAGVPQGGIAGMARALAPQTDMTQNTGVQAMAKGGPVKKMAAGDIVVRDGMQYVEQADGSLRLGDFQGGARIMQGLGLGGNNTAMEDFSIDFGVGDSGPSAPLGERIGGGIRTGFEGVFGERAIEKVMGPRGPAATPEPAAVGPDMETLARQSAEDAVKVRDAAGITESIKAPVRPDATPDPATDTAQSSGGGIAGIGGGAGGVSSYEQSLMDALASREKAATQDKWLALAQVGLNMMSSRNPTLLGAVGEAGLKGVEAARAARDQYDEDKLSLQGALEQSRLARAAASARAAAGASRGGITPYQAAQLDRDARRDAIDVLQTLYTRLSSLAPTGVPFSQTEDDYNLTKERIAAIEKEIYGDGASTTNVGGAGIDVRNP